MIALFDEPLRVTVKMKVAGNGPNAMLLGMTFNPTANAFSGVVCLEDGSLTMLPAYEISVDWRYNAETDQWSDLAHTETDQN